MLAVNGSFTFVVGNGGQPPYLYTADNGSVTSVGGVYTAVTSPGSAHVEVMDALGNKATATVTVVPGLSISPTSPRMSMSSTASFSASGGVAPYSFSASSGVISAQGNYTAPMSSGTATIIVTDALSNSSSTDVSIYRPGDLDATFGQAGKYLSSASDVNVIKDIIAQSDGKILVAGESWVVTPSVAFTPYLVRFNADGSSDSSFNSYVGSTYTENMHLLIDSSQRILLLSDVGSGSYYKMSVRRFLSNGTPDTSFNATGAQTISFGSMDDLAYSFTFDQDGKIVVVGRMDSGTVAIAVARLTTSGFLDTTFNGTGKAVTYIGSGHSYAYDVKVQSDGKILVVGGGKPAFSSPNNDLAVVRFNANGTLDSTFGVGGKTTFSLGGEELATNLQLQNDGKLVLGVYQSDAINRMILVRMTAEGNMDASFGSGGKAIHTLYHTTSLINDLKILPDGKLLVAAACDSSSCLARFSDAGALDPTFGTGGVVELSSTVLNTLQVTSAGYLIGGYTGNPWKSMMARYLP